MENNKNGKGFPTEEVMTVAKFVCTSCKKDVITRLPLFRVSNFPEFSSITCIHQTPVKCQCGTFHIPLFAGINENMKINLTWKQVEVTFVDKKEQRVPESSGMKQ